MRDANDAQLSEQVSKILRMHNDMNRALRDCELLELWKLLAEVQRAAELASFRILDLRGGV